MFSCSPLFRKMLEIITLHCRVAKLHGREAFVSCTRANPGHQHCCRRLPSLEHALQVLPISVCGNTGHSLTCTSSSTRMTLQSSISTHPPSHVPSSRQSTPAGHAHLDSCFSHAERWVFHLACVACILMLYSTPAPLDGQLLLTRHHPRRRVPGRPISSSRCVRTT